MIEAERLAPRRFVAAQAAKDDVSLKAENSPAVRRSDAEVGISGYGSNL